MIELEDLHILRKVLIEGIQEIITPCLYESGFVTLDNKGKRSGYLKICEIDNPNGLVYYDPKDGEIVITHSSLEGVVGDMVEYAYDSMRLESLFQLFTHLETGSLRPIKKEVKRVNIAPCKTVYPELY